MRHSALQNSTGGFYVFASDSTSLAAGKTGLTITSTLSKAGGTANAVSPTITEIGNGLYWVAPIAAHRDTLGEIAWQFAATGAVIAPRIEKIVAVNDQVQRFGAAAAGDAMALTSGERTTTATAVWANATRTLTALANVTVGGYATGQDPASLLSSTVTTVFQHLEQIQDSIDTYVSSALATVNGTQDTIVGFPDSLTVGDSYTEDSGNAIHVFIRDGNDDPISSVGSHDFTDTDFAPELVITNSGNAGRVRATVTYVDPGAAESYLKVEIPLAESRRAAPGSATMQCVLKWDGCAKTIATQSVTWVARI